MIEQSFGLLFYLKKPSGFVKGEVTGKNAQTDHAVAFEIDQAWRCKLTIA